MPPSSVTFPEIVRDCGGLKDTMGGESEWLKFREYPESATLHRDIQKNSRKTLLIKVWVLGIIYRREKKAGTLQLKDIFFT